MTNEEKFKDVEERVKAFDDYCGQKVCDYCKHSNKTGLGRVGCVLHWLADEYEEPDLPFEIENLDGGRYVVQEKTKKIPTSYFTSESIAKKQRDTLNAAVLAWHKQLCEKGE